MLARLAFLTVAASLLAGCFYADKPLITRRFAENPFAEGYYHHAPVDPETGEEWAGATWQGDIRYTRNRRYHSRIDDFPHQDARFRSLGGSVYLAEIPDRDGEDVYSYGLVWLYPGGVITYRAPHCSDLGEALRGQIGLSMDMEGGCKVEDLDVMMAAMSAWLELNGEDIRFDGIYRLQE